MVEAHVSAVIVFSQPLHNYVCQGSAVAGQNTTYIPHKGVLSPKEHVLYVSYSKWCGSIRWYSWERLQVQYLLLYL